MIFAIVVVFIVVVYGIIHFSIMRGSNTGKKKTTIRSSKHGASSGAAQRVNRFQAADDKVWFNNPNTKPRVMQARSELPMLYSKMQILQQRLLGHKVDANREEGTLYQHDVEGWAGLVVTATSAIGLTDSRKSACNVQSQIDRLQNEIDKRERIVERYERLLMK